MVLTKKELGSRYWWDQNVVFVEGNPADGDGNVLVFHISNFCFLDTSYERVLSVLVGSYYVDVRTLNSDVITNVVSEDLVYTRDALGKDFNFFKIVF